jgi:hypothetical protein
MFWFVSYNIFYIRKGWACFSRRTVSFIRLRVQGSVARAWNGTVSYLEDPAGLRTIYSTPLQTLLLHVATLYGYSILYRFSVRTVLDTTRSERTKEG